MSANESFDCSSFEDDDNDNDDDADDNDDDGDGGGCDNDHNDRMMTMTMMTSLCHLPIFSIFFLSFYRSRPVWLKRDAAELAGFSFPLVYSSKVLKGSTAEKKEFAWRC